MVTRCGLQAKHLTMDDERANLHAYRDLTEKDLEGLKACSAAYRHTGAVRLSVQCVPPWNAERLTEHPLRSSP